MGGWSQITQQIRCRQSNKLTLLTKLLNTSAFVCESEFLSGYLCGCTIPQAKLSAAASLWFPPRSLFSLSAVAVETGPTHPRTLSQEKEGAVVWGGPIRITRWHLRLIYQTFQSSLDTFSSQVLDSYRFWFSGRKHFTHAICPLC